MQDFQYQADEFYCEEVPLARIARDVGTPFYLYSHQALTRNFRAFDSAFEPIPHLVAYAVKANASLAILQLLARAGSGADIVSGGELFRALKAGMDPHRIVFAGVGKSREEIREALCQDILIFNVESPQELERIQEVAAESGRKARVAIRVNPDIDPQTHPYIATGLEKSKFGIGMGQALAVCQSVAALSHVELVGLHQHIGSQLVRIQPFVDALQRTLNLADVLREKGIPLEYLNLGGGLGIQYHQEPPPLPGDLARAVLPLLKDRKITLILEPGRSVVGQAGVLVTRVLYTKAGEKKRFVITDAGMNDLIRPGLYEAYHEIRPVVRVPGAPEEIVDVVGPVCESGDFLARDRALAPCRPGDLLAVMSAGAYGFVMASNYNARPRAAEVMVCKDRYAVIRNREGYEDLIRGEQIPEFLND